MGGRRRCAAIAGLCLLLVLALGTSPPPDLTTRAAAWLASLDPAQRRATLHSFEDDERFDLRLAPFFLEGLRRDGMTETQWEAWRRVLAAGLSAAGLRQVETVMSLEREVERRDRATWRGRLLGRFTHGEERYYAALFGEPLAGAPWGLRFDGHHVSLNWTVTPDGRVSLLPSFLGAEPREVPADGERAGLRALAREEDAARALWESLAPDQRARAELEFESAWGPAYGIRPLFVGEGERLGPAEPAGIARGALTLGQRTLLDALVDVYLSRMAEPQRQARWSAIDGADRDSLHFAWAGSFTPGEPLYYRVQGTALLIEFDDTVPEADHVHTVVRDVANDFGRDLLAEHHARHHHRPGGAPAR